jgi:Mrp family chromosome partitioning ATPase
MKGRIATDSMAHEFRLLRNRVEAEVHAPAVILVTSATDRDGAGVTAYGLAESLSKTHQRTTLVTTSMPAADAQQTLAPGPLAQRRRASDRLDGVSSATPGVLSVVAISHERLTTISRSNVASMVAGLRADHDYVVIDGGDLPNNSFALLLVASADATLVTFLSGRQQTPADRVMLDTLERAEAKMLGVVVTDQESIEQFAQRDVATENLEITVAKSAPKRLMHTLEIALQRIAKTS